MLQLSLDWMTLDQALLILSELHEYTDIIEVGTPILFEYGLKAVESIKDKYPQKLVLADMKIIDGGKLEVEMAIRYKADIVTIMAAANEHTVKIATQSAHDKGCKIMVDLLGVKDVGIKAKKMDELGVDFICVHTAFDMKEQQDRPIDELILAKQNMSQARTAIAGGITLKELDAILIQRPDIVIVGGGILNSSDRVATIREFQSKIRDDINRR